jgi:hypothetical protein
LKRLSVATAAAFVILFYIWTARAGAPLGVGTPQDGLYNLLTQAFAHGQLHLLEPPRMELFEMPDPFDPGRNAPYRLHDASLYHGRYYLYFGAAPVVALFLPWRALGLGDLPESLAALIFAAGAFLFSVLLLRHLLRRHLPETPAVLQVLAVLVLGFANVMPFLLRGATVYEVAISAGAFFLMGATCLLVTAADAEPPRAARLALGSLFLGLAVGSRANHVVLVPLVLLLAWLILGDSRIRLKAVAAALAPVGLCLLFLGLYNHARFGSWTEFGTRYCLVGHPPLPWYTPRVSVAPALYFDLVAPPAVEVDFPFLLPDTRFPGVLPQGFYAEPTTGLLFHSPFLLVLLAAPWLLRAKPSRAAAGLRAPIALLAAIGAACLLFRSLIVPWATMRYEADYAAFLLLAAILLLFLAYDRLRGRARRVLRIAFAASTLWTCAVMFALSLTGHDDTLRTRNPRLFQSLARRFAWYASLTRPFAGWTPPPVLGRLFENDGLSRHRVYFRLAMPDTLTADREPLLSSGTVESADVLWVQSAGPGRWTLTLQPARGAEVTSSPLDLAPGSWHDVDVDLDRASSRVVVRIDGAERASLVGVLAPLRAATITLGCGPRGKGADDRGHFSGTILSQGLLWAAAPDLQSLPPIAKAPVIEADQAPVDPALGQLWMRPRKEGAYLFDGDAWRWIPRYRSQFTGIEARLRRD